MRRIYEEARIAKRGSSNSIDLVDGNDVRLPFSF